VRGSRKGDRETLVFLFAGAVELPVHGAGIAFSSGAKLKIVAIASEPWNVASTRNPKFIVAARELSVYGGDECGTRRTSS
jgi:hypothetical protein